jgi:hypothetical protein
MLLLTILSYCRLFHFKLFLFIVNYFTLDFLAILSNFNIWLLVAISCFFIGAISGYCINGY